MTDNGYSSVFKTRIFMVHLLLREVNGNLKGERVRFKDCLNRWEQ